MPPHKHRRPAGSLFCRDSADGPLEILMLRPPISGGKVGKPPRFIPDPATALRCAKPVACSVCPRRFAMPISLALHVAREHGQAVNHAK